MSQGQDVLVGVDIGGTKTAVVLSRTPPVVLWREEFATRPGLGPQHALDTIATLIERGLETLNTQPSAIGISCGGPLDPAAGVIQQPPNLLTWKNVQIASLLRSRFGVRCALENDANAGAIAEQRYGAGQGCDHLIFLTLGTGLGAGLILNRRLYRGATAMAGEIGHVRLSSDGPSGYGKAGSVEGWASGGGMAQHAEAAVRLAMQRSEATTLTDAFPNVSARDVGEALLSGDALAARIVHATGERLGDALAILVDILNPQRIIVGGLALRLGEHLLAPARARLLQEALWRSASACTIVRAALGEQIGDVAALCIASDALGAEAG